MRLRAGRNIEAISRKTKKSLQIACAIDFINAQYVLRFLLSLGIFVPIWTDFEFGLRGGREVVSFFVGERTGGQSRVKFQQGLE